MKKASEQRGNRRKQYPQTDRIRRSEKITPQDANRIGDFFETRSMNRLQTAKLIYESSRNNEKKLPATYSDYSEAVAAAYYSMFYIVHAYLACVYNTKLREGIRGVHAITNHLVLFYLVKTNKLAKHLYEEYLATLETTSSLSIIVKRPLAVCRLVLIQDGWQERLYTSSKYLLTKGKQHDTD